MASKAELIKAVAEQTGMQQTDVEKTAGALFDCIVAEVKKGEKVSWPGFGTFARSERAARMGRNPQTGAPLHIKASRSLKLTVSGNLKKELSAGMM